MKLFNRRDFLRLTAASTVAASHRASAAPPRIKCGQIGVGHAHAAGKMETMRRSDDWDVVGLVEPDPAKRAAAEKSPAYAGLKWMTEDELLNTPGLQAVAVEREVKDLVSTGARCIAAGKHIHLDKPAGESLPAFKRLLDDATREKLIVQLGYMLRYNAAFQRCFELVRDGSLGEIFSVDTAMSKVIGANERKELTPYRGGSMFELGCHVIDAVVSVLGKPVKVTSYSRNSSPVDDGFADNGMAVLEYPKATAVVRSAMLEVEGGARRQFVVCGTKGTFDIRPIEPPKVRVALDVARGELRKGYQDLAMPKAGGRYDGEFADLAKVIRGEKAFAFTPEHDLAVHETVLRASGLPVH
ncbi:MAG TPA: Gfo/Idh/MocA family oxidoreductase [Chthoniobacteraceae bacterium]|nr:Gfo/Idh/MocA family oxidoreductase [Chthoniobacteraceae bacterium]